MICFLDMDGVLVDFVSGVCAVHRRENPYISATVDGMLASAKIDYSMEQLWNMSPSEFWEPLDHEFWRALPWMPDGPDILDACIAVFGHENICLLSSPTDSPLAASGKVAWIQEQCNGFKHQYFIGPKKHFCAYRDAVLIDDYDRYIVNFRQAGGRAILIPRPWNQLHSVDTMSYFLEQLKIYVPPEIYYPT